MAPRGSTSIPLPHPDGLPRVILLMDVDCFEVQVWAKRKGLDPERDPIIVVNHLDMMLSINYEARKLGIPKSKKAEKVDVEELEDRYPTLRIIRAELKRGLTDTLLLQKESDKILDAIQHHPMFTSKSMVVERPNNDEVYLDITGKIRNILYARPVQCGGLGPRCNRKWCPSCCVRLLSTTSGVDDPMRVLLEDSEQVLSNRMSKYFVESCRRCKCTGNCCCKHGEKILLMYGAAFARAFCSNILEKTGYKVSFGVAHNKMLAKIACEENKPNSITMLTNRGSKRLLKYLEFRKLPGFRSETGEKFCNLARWALGRDLETLEDVRNCDTKDLDNVFELMGYNSSEVEEATDSLKEKLEGTCTEPVRDKLNNEAIRKSLPLYGVNAVDSGKQLQRRIQDLAVVFHSMLVYNRQRLDEEPDIITVTTELRGHRRVRSTLEVESGLPTIRELRNLIREHVRDRHGSRFRDVHRINLVVSKFFTTESGDDE